MNDPVRHEFFLYLFRKEIFIAEEQGLRVNYFKLEGNENAPTTLLILMKNENSEKLSAPEQEVLTRMLVNTKANIQHVTIVNLHHQHTTFAQLRVQFRPENIICFGILPGEIGLQLEVKKNQLIGFMDSKIIFTGSLKEIEEDGVLKKRFWYDAVVYMFNLPKAKKK